MQKHSGHSLIQPILLLIAAMVSIQIGASFAKQLFPVFGAAGVATLRLCFASIILCSIFRPWRHRFTYAGYKALLWYGLSMGGMNILIYLSLDHIPLGIAIALEFIGPLGVAVLTSKKPVDFIWVLLAAIGIILLLPFSSQHNVSIEGIAYALGAGVCWGLYIVFGQKAGKLAPSGVIAASGMGVATLLVAPIGLMQHGSQLMNITMWPGALCVAVLSSALPYCLEMIALKALPARIFGVLMSMEPAIAALCGLIILHERLTNLQWAAISCIMLASGGVVVFSRKKPAVIELNV